MLSSTVSSVLNKSNNENERINFAEPLQNLTEEDQIHYTPKEKNKFSFKITLPKNPIRKIKYKQNKLRENCKCIQCSNENSLRKEIIRNLANKYLSITRTCQNKDEIKTKLINDIKTDEFFDKIDKYNLNRTISTTKKLNEIPIMERYYCLPQFIASLDTDLKLSTKPKDYIRKLIESGYNIFHLDVRYNTRSKYYKEILSIYEACADINADKDIICPVGIAIEITRRDHFTGLLSKNNSVTLERLEKFTITCKRTFIRKGSSKIIYVNCKDTIKRLEKDDNIYIGKYILLRCIEVMGDDIICIVVSGGQLNSEMPVHFPHRRIDFQAAVTAEQEEDIMLACDSNANIIVCQASSDNRLNSFIRWIMGINRKSVLIFGKIDTRKSYQRRVLETFAKEFSGFWIENDGDGEVSDIEMELIELFMQNKKPIIQNGNFFEEHGKHLRIPNLYKNISNKLLFPDCIRLSPNVFENCSITYLRRRISTAYISMNIETLYYSLSLRSKTKFHLPDILVQNAVIASAINNVSCIITVSNSLNLPAKLSQNRPLMPIIATVKQEITAQNLSVWKNVYPIVYLDLLTLGWEEEVENRIAYAQKYAKENGFFDESLPFMVCYDSKADMTYSDSYKIICFKENLQ